MNACFSEKFLKNGNVLPKNEFHPHHPDELCIYEVIRVLDGVCLFLEDHLQRFENSLKLLKIQYNVNELLHDINDLLAENAYADGNIRTELFIKNDSTNLYTYYIEHHYPSEEQYSMGVAMKMLVAERNNPNAKMVHDSIKSRINEMLKNPAVYEIVLVNQQGLITEGSRSNLFFLKNSVVYTAPEHLVLAGITRKYVLEAIRNLNLKIVEKAVHTSEMNNFNAAFLSGTSPKVLPVNKIEQTDFNPVNPVIVSILNEYNRLINAYIQSKK